MKDKIKATLEQMKKEGEIDKIQKYYKNNEEIQQYCNDLKNVNVMELPIIPLIMTMPKEIMRDLLCYLTKGE